MTLLSLRKGAALLAALAVSCCVCAHPAAADLSPATPQPCAAPAPLKATTTRTADDNAAVTAFKQRVADIDARHPDRRLSAYSSVNEVGEGWRYGWRGGQRRYVSFLNRHGAMLTGTAFAPDPRLCPGRRPVVLITEGITANEVLYWYQAESLAEAGYVVLTFDYMNQGLSEAFGHTPDGQLVPPLCADTSCSRGGDPATGFLQDAEDALEFLLSTPSRPYRYSGPVLATDKPFDRAFPYADEVDPGYVGLTGHSEGARVASVLQGVDRRVGAVVALDNLATRLKGDQGSASSQCVEGGLGTDTQPVVPRVPALGLAAPNNTACNDPELKKFAYDAWRAKQLPAAEMVVAGAQHTDWSPNPTLTPGNAAVPDLTAYWTIGWFDRWLLRDPAAELRVLQAPVTLFDHYTGPFTLTRKGLFDPTFVSSANTGTNNCPDLRVGCLATLPRLAAQDDNGDGSSAGDPTGASAGTEDGSGLGLTASLSPLPPLRPSVSSQVGPSSRPGSAPVTSTFEEASGAPAQPAGVGALAVLPLAGGLLGLGVLIGFRRHERLARRLGLSLTTP